MAHESVSIGRVMSAAGALLWTLGQGLGEEFTPEVKEAWGTVYGVLAATMQEGAAAAA